MNEIFTFTNREDFYKKCLYASIAHAIMVGKYPLLSEEIAWDGNNFLIQNMEGTRAVFAFAENYIVCAVQNEREYIEGTLRITEKLVDSTNHKLTKIVKEEILPYFLIAPEDIPAITTMFWNLDGSFWAYMNEKKIMKKSDNILLPYLYEFNDLIKYWRDYYEASDKQMRLINELFEKRIIAGHFLIDGSITQKLLDWFGDDIDCCKQSLCEIGIDWE